MGRESGVEVFFVELEGDGSGGVGEVSGDGYVFAVGIPRHEYSGRSGVSGEDVALTDGWSGRSGVSGLEGYDLGAGLDEVGEMLHCIIFRGVADGARVRIKLYESILMPAPFARSFLGEKEIPVIPFVATFADVVGYEEEGVFAGAPVHVAVATLTFRTYVAEIRILTADGGEYFTSFPLKGEA